MSADIGSWLRANRLGKHADLFAANAIDFDVVAELDESDLKELGLPLGDRKRFMKAIAAPGDLSAAVETSPAPAPAAYTPKYIEIGRAHV